MITQDRLTGGRQFMNMDQFHRFGQSELHQEMIADNCIKRIISLHAIHYANIRKDQGGTIHGIVWCLPSPPFYASALSVRYTCNYRTIVSI